MPPTYSAAKVTGRRAYDLARRGQEVSLQARPIEIYGIDLLAKLPVHEPVTATPGGQEHLLVLVHAEVESADV